MLGDVIVEIAYDGDIVKKWYSWQHLAPDEEVICPLQHRTEWSHANSLMLTPAGEWLVSFRRIDTVAIIRPDTGSFRSKWGQV